MYTSDLDIFLDTENETNYVEPDISIICDDSKFFKNGYKGVPELIVEVASRATRPRDRGVKFKLYEKYGVKEYWLIEPKLKSIEQYVLIDGRYDLHKMVELLSETEFNDLTVDERESYTTIIKSTIFNDLEINLNEIILKADKETDKD